MFDSLLCKILMQPEIVHKKTETFPNEDVAVLNTQCSQLLESLSSKFSSTQCHISAFGHVFNIRNRYFAAMDILVWSRNAWCWQQWPCSVQRVPIPIYRWWLISTAREEAIRQSPHTWPDVYTVCAIRYYLHLADIEHAFDCSYCRCHREGRPRSCW